MRVLALLVLLLACDSPRTEIVLRVDTDVAGAQTFRVVVVSPSGTSRTSTAMLDTQVPPRTLVLRHRGGALGPMRATIDALDAEGRALVSVVRELTFEQGQIRTLEVFLAEACRTASCPVVETCGNAGECRAPAVLPCEYEDGCLAPGSDAGMTDAGSCNLPEICALQPRYLPGDRITPAPCAPTGATIEVTGPDGALTPAAGAYTLRDEGTYLVRLTDGAACTIERATEVATPIVIEARGLDVGDPRDIAARIGTAFVAATHGAFAIDAAGWHDLREVGSGTVVPEDLDHVAIFQGDAWFGPHQDHDAVFRVMTASPFDTAAHSEIMLPDGGREVRGLVPRADLLLVATKDGAVTIIGGEAREVGPTYDSSWAALANDADPEAATVLGRRDQLLRLAADEPRPIPIPESERDTVAAEISGDRLWLCTDRSVAVYELASISSSLPRPIARWSGACADIALDETGAWVAGGNRLVRLDLAAEELARIDNVSVDRIALARNETAREVWMLDIDQNRVLVLSGAVL
jgi:hypothetical protein